MENRGVFNRQWKLRPVVPYHISVLPRPKLSQAHGSDAKRVKIAAKPQKNGNESGQIRQVEQIKHIFLWLGRVSKTGRILSEKGRPEIFAANGS